MRFMYKELEVDSSGVLYIANNCRAQACICAFVLVMLTDGCQPEYMLIHVQ